MTYRDVFRSCVCVWIACGALMSGPLCAEALTYPPEGWEPAPSPQASEWAEPGGRMRIFLSQYPSSFNYYLDATVSSSRIFGYLYETLIGRDGLTLEPEPGLAEKVVVSEDKTTFTFTLDPEARWSDGKPVTADDVVWTFNAIMDKKHLTGPHKVRLSRFDPPEKLDERTVRFTANEVHWLNLWSAGGMQVLPSHWWKKQPDFNKVNFEFPVVSGPYRIQTLNEPHSLVLEKREDYWASDDPRGEGLLNFDELEFIFYPERDLAFDYFRAGNFDMFAVYKAQRWATETDTEAFQKNHLVKQAVHNHNPVGFQGFAMNMRRDNYKDVRVRKALAHLLDRPRMNETLMYNQYSLTASYYSDLYPEDNPNDLIPFDVSKARALLNEAGWTVNEEGHLTKDGKPFVINFLTRSGDAERFLLIYREALREVGIQLKIVRKDWSAWVKDMQEFNFDMTWSSWSAGVFKDPESMWHSKYKDLPNGNNITGFADERVDELIERIKGEFDLEKRREVIREIDAILVDHVPYVLLWNIDYVRLLYWNRFGMPDQVLTKYGDDSSAEALWWADPMMEADLKAARESGDKLPPRPPHVMFDKVFDGPTRAQPLN